MLNRGIGFRDLCEANKGRVTVERRTFECQTWWQKKQPLDFESFVWEEILKLNIEYYTTQIRGSKLFFKSV
jgi:hypothetical protein